jgi:putative ABC transport system ATP-binding protein
MAVIELTDISKVYGFGEATTVALDEVNLHINSGEFVAVMGPSGSGKSTLMNMLGVLDTPSHGSYKLNGREVSRFGSRKRAKTRRDTVGFVFQSFHLLYELTALENVALPLAYKGITKTRRLKKAGDMLDRVGLATREYFYPGQLSGGQLQRVAIARALVNNPQIIIADEPTGNLDSVSSRLVMELLSDMHKAGNTILMVTHNPELTRYATRVLFMHDGAIIGDEKSKIGDIPENIRRSMYFEHVMTVKDDLEGVSTLMKELPTKDRKVADEPKKKTKSKSKKSKKYSARKKKKESKK